MKVSNVFQFHFSDIDFIIGTGTSRDAMTNIPTSQPGLTFNTMNIVTNIVMTQPTLNDVLTLRASSRQDFIASTSQ